MRATSLLRLLLAVFLLLIAVSLLTRPVKAELDARMPHALRLAVMSGAFVPDNATVAQGLSEICKVSASACYELVKPQVAQIYTDHHIYNRHALIGFGKVFACAGAFGKIRCGTRAQ